MNILRLHATLRVTLIAALLATGMSAAGDPERPAAAAGAAQIEATDPNNLCFGGLEDRKRIVHELHLVNPFKETTKLGCEVDGGQPAQMPDLPAPVAVQTRLV